MTKHLQHFQLSYLGRHRVSPFQTTTGTTDGLCALSHLQYHRKTTPQLETSQHFSRLSISGCSHLKQACFKADLTQAAILAIFLWMSLRTLRIGPAIPCSSFNPASPSSTLSSKQPSGQPQHKQRGPNFPSILSPSHFPPR